MNDMLHEARRLHNKGEELLVGGHIYSLLDLYGPVITCDMCGRWQRVPKITEERICQKARELGWTRKHDQDLCPVCSAAGDKTGRAPDDRP